MQNNTASIKTEVLDIVDYNPEVHGPPRRLPRKYYGEQKVGDQHVFFFYDSATDDENMDSDLDVESLPRPFKVKVRKLNDVNDQFVCVHPPVDETKQFEPRLPRMKHIKAFDEAMADKPKALLTQSVPSVTAVFQRVRHNICSSSVRTAAVEVSFNAPPQRRFLDTNPTFDVPAPQPTLSRALQAEVVESLPAAEQDNSFVAEDTNELEVRLLNGLPELTDAEVNMFSFSP